MSNPRLKHPLLLLSHGTACTGLKNSVELIMGEQPDIYAIPLTEGMNMEVYTDLVRSLLFRLDHPVVFIDLPGGSPSRVMSYLILYGYDIPVYTGMNLPMIIGYINASWSGISFSESNNPVEWGRQGISWLNESLRNNADSMDEEEKQEKNQMDDL